MTANGGGVRLWDDEIALCLERGDGHAPCKCTETHWTARLVRVNCVGRELHLTEEAVRPERWWGQAHGAARLPRDTAGRGLQERRPHRGPVFHIFTFP